MDGVSGGEERKIAVMGEEKEGINLHVPCINRKSVRKEWR
jgi:hypothetical protein